MIATPWYRYYTKYRSYFTNNLNKIRKKDEVKAYLELILSLGTIIVFSTFALRPTLTTIAVLFKANDYKQTVIEQMDTKIENLKKAQELLTSESTKISFINQAIPSSPQPDTLVRQIEGITQEKNISLSYLNLGKAPLINSVPSLPENISISLAMNSNFSDTLSLISAIESLRRQIVITGVTIKSEQRLSVGTGMEITSTINGYSQFNTQ